MNWPSGREFAGMIRAAATRDTLDAMVRDLRTIKSQLTLAQPAPQTHDIGRRETPGSWAAFQVERVLSHIADRRHNDPRGEFADYIREGQVSALVEIADNLERGYVE